MKSPFWICSVGFDALVKVVPEKKIENRIRHTIITILFSEREREKVCWNYRIRFIKLTYIIFEPLDFVKDLEVETLPTSSVLTWCSLTPVIRKVSSGNRWKTTNLISPVVLGRKVQLLMWPQQDDVNCSASIIHNVPDKERKMLLIKFMGSILWCAILQMFVRVSVIFF